VSREIEELTAVGVVERDSGWVVAELFGITDVVVDHTVDLLARSVGRLEGVEDAEVVVPGAFDLVSKAAEGLREACLTWR